MSSAPSTPGSLTPAPLQKAPGAGAHACSGRGARRREGEEAEQAEPRRSPPRRSAGLLLEAVEADVRAARAAPAPKPAPSAEPPKPAVRAARGAGEGAGAPKFGYESLLSDVSRAYCGYDEAYFHDRPRELASQEKAGQAARAAADAREVVASREGCAALVQGRRARGGRGAAAAAEARQNYKGDEEG